MKDKWEGKRERKKSVIVKSIWKKRWKKWNVKRKKEWTQEGNENKIQERNEREGRREKRKEMRKGRRNKQKVVTIGNKMTWKAIFYSVLLVLIISSTHSFVYFLICLHERRMQIRREKYEIKTISRCSL